MLQSAKRQECMVDCSQPIAGNYDDFAAQLGDQVPCGKALSQGHEQTADSLNEQALATPGDSPDSPQDFRQAYEAMMSSGGNQRSKRFGKKEGGYFVRRQFAILCCPQEFCVRSAAGAERFHGQRVAAALPQVMEQQSGEQSFANASVGTRNEDDAWRIGPNHGEQLTRDEAG